MGIKAHEMSLKLTIKKKNTFKMKLFNIVSTAAIFSSTLTWAKNLEKLLEEAGKITYEEEYLMIADLHKKSERVDAMTEDL